MKSTFSGITRIIVICALSLLAVACSKPNVIVVDASGSPVEGAFVEPISLSMNYSPVSTDKHGEVYIADGAQPVKWIHISKTGYTRIENIDFTQPKPIKVVLLK